MPWKLTSLPSCSSRRIFASGGIAGIEDIEALCAVEEEGVEGAILGRSIYEGALNFQAAQTRADELAKS